LLHSNYTLTINQTTTRCVENRQSLR
jgi:hypothetical protein